MTTPRRWPTMALLVLAGATTCLAQDEDAGYYVFQIRGASGSWGKAELAKKFARLGTPNVRDAFLELWRKGEKEAAIEGMLLMDDPAFGDPLLEWALKGSYFQEKVGPVLKKRLATAIPALRRRYPSLKTREDRRFVIDTASVPDVAEAAAFLKAIAGDGKAQERAYALAKLTAHFPGHAAFAKSMLSEKTDKALRHEALAYLAAHGGRDRVPLFRKIIAQELASKRPSSTRVGLAYRGIGNWADEAILVKVFRSAFFGKDDGLARTAVTHLGKANSPALMKEVLRLCRTGRTQHTRIAATAALTAFEGSAPVPTMVAALTAQHQAPRLTGAERTFVAATLGFGGLFIQKKWTPDELTRLKKVIAADLAKRTGANFGTKGHEWLDWALAHGHGVAGRNIIQMLFSGRADRRRKAVEASARLLGLGTVAEMRKKLRPESDTALAFALARRLAAKGFLADQEEAR